MSSVSLNKSFDQAVGPIVEDEAIGPEVEEASSVAAENVAQPAGKFSVEKRKYFPITRKLMTGSSNGDMGQLSAFKKVVSFFTGFFLVLFMTSIACVPVIALKNRKIRAFNVLSTEDQSKKILNTQIKKVVAAAKAYQCSPDSHEAKQALAKQTKALAQLVDKIQLEFPDQAAAIERLIREKVDNALKGIVISLRPKSSQDQHRFTVPLAKLVLDGFYPIINGTPNPFMKGVKAESVSYQFEDGVFQLSPERIVDIFLKQASTNPLKALRDLETNLQKVKRPAAKDADEVRTSVRDTIAEKLNNPASPEFQSVVTGAQLQCAEINALAAQVMTPDQVNQLTSSLVASNILTNGQADVFAAQVLGTDAPHSATLNAEIREHDKKAKKAALALVPVGIISALERLGVGPSRGLELLAKHVPNKFTEALLACAKSSIASKAVALGSAAVGLYGLFHGFKALTGPKLTRGQEAAESFAHAVTLRKASLDKLKDIEFQTFEGESADTTPVAGPEVEALQKALVEGESMIAQAGEALEAAGKNPTPQNVERAAQLSEQANQRFAEVAEQADRVETEVQKMAAISGKPSYVDLSRYFREAKRALGRVDKELQGADGRSLKGGKKIDELQRELPKKLEALRSFESVDLQQATENVRKVEELEAAIQTVLANKQTDPAKAEKWEKSHRDLKLQLQYRQGRIQETLARYAYLQQEIRQMRDLISLLTPQG